MISQLIQPEIRDLIEHRDFVTLKEVLIDWEPADIADLIKMLTENEQAILFRLLPKELGADTFEYFDLDTQMDIISALRHEEVGQILNEMSPDDRTELLEELPAPVARRMLTLMSQEERKIAQVLLGYPENSVGRLMTPDYMAINKDMTVKEALDYIRENGKDSETLNVIYVVDERGRLLDDIRIKEFLISPLDEYISELMDYNYDALNVHNDQETAIEVFKKYDRTALPVIDSDGTLLGIVTIDDVMDVVEEETSEDIYKTAAVQVLEDPYVETSVFSLIKKRAGWLSVLFIGEMFTASAMGFFEHEIEKAVVLALFVPLIISSGGNSGSQASTLITRALALGELKLRDWFFVFRRELISGLILGTILAIIGFLRIFVWEIFSDLYGHYWFLIAVTVCMSLIGVVLWGTLVGSMLPLILKRFGLDPAVSSAPFVATLVDVFGIVIYFSIAIIFLKGILL